MSNPFGSDEDVLDQLVREAGDPSVSPDQQYAESLKATILGRVTPAVAAETVREAAGVYPRIPERRRKMKRIAKLAVAATILATLGILISWLTIGGGSTSIAFADVAKALDNLRSATFDLTSEATDENGNSSAKATGKGFFLAPARQRMEVSLDIANSAVKAAAEAARRMHGADSQAAKAAAEAAAKSTAEALARMPKTKITQVTIADSQAAKVLMLTPSMKIAIAMDMKKMYADMKKSGKGLSPDLFDMVRRIVREGSDGTGEKAERLGQKEIDGHKAVGFSVRNAMNGMGDMTLWADPQTARPIRIEIAGELGAKFRMVMNNFCYDVDLNPSLFSLEPPEGYSTQAIAMTMPSEEDLLRTLRTVAEHNHGEFPAELSMNKAVVEAAMAGDKAMIPTMDKATMDKIAAEMKKIEAKYGGKEKLRAKYGSQLPPEIMAEFMKTTMPIAQEQWQKQMRGQSLPMGRELQGITFYKSLKPENDAHYGGKGVKLDTPAYPILWYKPTGAEKYRVIYADLSVKEMTLEEVKKLGETKPQ